MLDTDKLKINKSSVIITHNDLNKVSFPGFEKRELDFLYGAIIALYNKGESHLSVSLDEMFDKVGFTEVSKTKSQLGAWVDNFSERASRVICPMVLIDPDDTDTFAYIPFFGAVSFNFAKNVISFSVNPSISYMIQKQKTNYTAFSFGEFTSLKKKYSKLLFRILSQWKTHGECSLEMSEFRRLLDIPETYKKASKVKQVVIDPSLIDLAELFPGLTCTAVIRKRKTLGYKFTWDAEYFKAKKSSEIAKKNATKKKAITSPKDITSIYPDSHDNNGISDEELFELLKRNF